MNIGQSAAREHLIFSSVGGEKRNGDSPAPQSVGNVADIFAVISVAAVFILNLNENNIAAVRKLMLCKAE